jgi:SAM-dependent methyltransferase
MRTDAVVWNDVECGAYSADLELWERLAAGADGPILDLGCGTGRVGTHLARRGYELTGLELQEELVDAFNDRAAGLPARAVRGDARDFALPGRFALALAPMQLIQLFADSGERVACMRCVAAHLQEGGRVAFALVEDVPPAQDGELPLPDVREVEGWIYSSLPLDIRVEPDAIAIRRLRQVVSPTGALSEVDDHIQLQTLTAQRLEREARLAGLRPAARHNVPATEAHVGSTVLVLRRGPDAAAPAGPLPGADEHLCRQGQHRPPAAAL